MRVGVLADDQAGEMLDGAGDGALPRADADLAEAVQALVGVDRDQHHAVAVVGQGEHSHSR